MTQLTLGKALGAGLRQAMRDDDRVVLLGEDIGKLGGCSASPMDCSTSSAPRA